jgi:hypothetical protein
VSELRASRDHVVVLRAALTRAGEALAGAWRDEHARGFRQDVLGPLEHEADEVARAISTADQQIDASLTTLRRLEAQA